MEISINTNECSGIDIQSENQNSKIEENKGKKGQLENNEDNKENRKEDEENDKEDNKEENKEENKNDNKENDTNNKEEDKDENNKDNNDINKIKENILEEKQKIDLNGNTIINNINIENYIDNQKEEENNNDINIENLGNSKDEQSEGSQNEIQYSHNLLEEIKNYNIQKMPENYTKENANFKILFLGDSGVGKSSLVIRGLKKTFDLSYNPTVGFDLLNYLVKINEVVLKMQIWDTCGQEEFSMCNQSLFKNASMAIMIYSITNKKSYENIKKWVSRLKTLSKEETILFLVGNKSDLVNQREVDFLEAKNYGNDNFEFFIETSSKNGFNVDILFKKIPIFLYENKFEKELNEKEESNIEEYISDDQTSSLLDSQNLGVPKKKKCLKCCC